MAITIVFANQKGGVGKTTTTANIAAFMAEKSLKVLALDFDPQGNLSSALGHNRPAAGIYEVLTRSKTMADIIVTTSLPTLFLAPATINLSAASTDLRTVDNSNYCLKEVLKQVQEQYDYILIDCPPSLDFLTINGIAAADYIITPIQCEFFAAQGFLTMLFTTITRVQKNINPNLKLLGIVFTMYDGRTLLSNEVIEKITTSLKNPAFFFKTVIPRNVRLAEAPSHGLPINLYDANSIGASRYKSLTDEVLDRV